MGSGAAMVQRKGHSSPCSILGNSSQGDSIWLDLVIAPFGRLLAYALSPDGPARASFNRLNPLRAKVIGAGFPSSWNLLEKA